MASRADEVGSLVALTGLDEEEAGILLDAAGGDVEMAVSLHFGDQADEELYWSDEEADRLLDEELERGAKEKTAEFINRVQTKEQVAAQSATMAKRRDRKSRAKLRGEEAEALLRAPTLADAGRAPEGAAQGHSHESPAGGKGTGRFSVFAAHSDSGSDFDSDASASDGGEDSDASSSSEEWVDDDWVANNKECLFDGHQSATFEENCEYMQRVHSFFVPYSKYLVNADGLFAYLQEKIYSYNTCIYCNRAFGDLEACRKHMKDKSHCKVNFEDDDGALELSEFFNFGKSWMARHAFRRAAFRDRSTDKEELVLPNGVRLGHRSMHRFYKQKEHHTLGVTVRANRSESHRFYEYRRPVGGRGARRPGGAVINAYQDLQNRIALREENKARNGILVRAAAVAGGNSKALPGQYTFKADFADNAAARAVVHHWGAGGGGSHYHMAGSKQFLKGVRVKGVVSRHSRQGAKLEASRAAARNRKNRGCKAHADLRG